MESVWPVVLAFTVTHTVVLVKDAPATLNLKLSLQLILIASVVLALRGAMVLPVIYARLANLRQVWGTVPVPFVLRHFPISAPPPKAQRPSVTVSVLWDTQTTPEGTVWPVSKTNTRMLLATPSVQIAQLSLHRLEHLIVLRTVAVMLIMWVTLGSVSVAAIALLGLSQVPRT